MHLLLAAKFGAKHAIKLLIEYGAVLESRDKSWRTALEIAILEGHEDIVDVLIAAGARVE